MFTGLIEEVGRILSVARKSDSVDLTVGCSTVLDGLEIDDSVALDGCCQTVIARDEQSFTVTAVRETLAKTTLGSWDVGRPVNLERALRIGDRLGGHFVTGHVDATGEIVEVIPEEAAHMVRISFAESHAPLVIDVGSITVDGVSLTVARRGSSDLTVAIIPHTWQVTTIGEYEPGRQVNLEFDMIGKYVRNFVAADRS